jgi:hypothetical protein
MAHMRMLQMEAQSRGKSLKLAVYAAFCLQACAAGTELSSYPRRQIDRPYTLPSGVDAWEVNLGGRVARENVRSTGELQLQPLSWHVPLSDDWMLDLTPLPSGIAYQFVRTDDQLLGAKLALGWAFGSEGFLFAPLLRVDHRMRLTSFLAWTTTASGMSWRWTDEPAWGWSLGASTGPLWQVTDTFALQPAISVAAARSHLLGGLYSYPLDTADLIVPVGMGASLGLARQWDVNASFNYDGIGAPPGYRIYSATLAAAHFW